MALIVQKYGGSSVADAECMRRVARRILKTRDEGNSVVVVVSAMGDTTDELIELAKEVHADPNDRELDALMATGEQISCAVLAMALHAVGAEAVSMTGPQAGIFTDEVHTKAKIRHIRPKRLLKELRRGRIVIVAGFQGLNPNEDIATLGRGGSDTTAVALAAAIGAGRCQILKDVDGVFTANPRVVPEARKLDEISYDEMLELASLGAEVLQSRAVEFAKNYHVTLEVMSSFHEKPGTLVREEVRNMEDIVVRGVACDKGQAKVTVSGVPDTPGTAARLFKELARNNINVDMIVQNVGANARTDVTFTVPRTDLSKTKRVLDALEHMSSGGVTVDEDIAKVSIVGVGMRSHSGVAARMFDALARTNVNIAMIATSEIKISVVIGKADADKAVQALHKAFELGRPSGGKRGRAAVSKGGR
jgi:aspartate kinase